MDFFQRGDGGLQGEVAGQQGPAEAAPRQLDLLGHGNLFLAGEERNFGHLAQIRADRVRTGSRQFHRIVPQQAGALRFDLLGRPPPRAPSRGSTSR